MNAYATELRDRHHAWMAAIRKARPECDPTQASTEAIELALEGLRDRLGPRLGFPVGRCTGAHVCIGQRRQARPGARAGKVLRMDPAL